jgi:hypothetical protein
LEQVAEASIEAALSTFERVGAATGNPIFAIVARDDVVVTWRCVGDEPGAGQYAAAKNDARMHRNGVSYSVGVVGTDSIRAEELRNVIAEGIAARLPH